MTCMLIAHFIVASNQVFTYNHFHSIYEVINNVELAHHLGNPEKEMLLPLLLQTIYFSKTVKYACMTTLTLIFHYIIPLVSNTLTGLLSLVRSENQETLIACNHGSNSWPIAPGLGHVGQWKQVLC